MKITIGFTRSDHDAGYVSFYDGYQAGADQDTIEIELPDEYSTLPRAYLAEAVFIASNIPAEGLEGQAPVVLAIYKVHVGHRQRSLSVGDTVTIAGVTLACERHGWRELKEGLQ